MIFFPPCKINLGLNIIGKRTDGYHEIETCFYPLPFTDILEIIPSDNFHFSASGNSIPGKDKENLCVMAYHALRSDYDLPPVKIHLHKTIPTGAGLGGGSSDAAYTLRMLNIIFKLNLSNNSLQGYANDLGSDCAFFVQDQPQLGKGRGEILENINVRLKEKYVVLINPGIHVSTAEAYANVTPGKPALSVKDIIENYACEEWKDLLNNDFETSIFKKYPAIKDIKEKLYNAGAFYASMSGSGSTVFGIFNQQPNSDNFTSVIWQGFLKEY